MIDSSDDDNFDTERYEADLIDALDSAFSEMDDLQIMTAFQAIERIRFISQVLCNLPDDEDD